MSMDMSDRIVVVGTSLAGLRAIEAMRREGYGGEIVALSAERHLPYDRPPLSKQFLKGEWEEEKLSLRRQGFDDLEIDWRLGTRATGLDIGAKILHFEEGEDLAYGGLLIASGSRAKRLPGSEGLAGVHVLRSLEDATSLRAELKDGARLVVIGAGFIGMEVAASSHELGLHVTVVESLASPLMRGLGSTLGEFVAARHREQGVAIRCGVMVEGLVGDARVEGVALGDGSVLPADVVVVGIGVTPECDWLDGAGLEIDDGIVCDARGATAAPDVVAAGDVARWLNPIHGRAIRYEHWTSAVEQSSVAAARLVHGPDGCKDLAQVPYVWSDQFGLRLAIAGEVRDGNEMYLCHGTLEEGRCLALFGDRGKLVGAVGLRRPRQLNAARELIERGASWDDALAANA
jgi:NADPH-dependent 2,4-dienoyl-CoA reductase/sulfur reductase-like enzyme